MIVNTLHTLVARGDLSREEARAAVDSLLEEGASAALAAAWLVALRMKGETVEELAGVVDALRARASTVDIVDSDAVDTCGTGGDGAATFNISTTAAFVVAGAGATVAKHGNRAVSSRSGSADVLMALGVDLDAPLDKVVQAIDRERIGFLFAPRHHPAMRFVAPVRRELGLRTVFNLAGPLSNPAGVRRQVVGVYSADLVETIARTLGTLGAKHVWVVHGAGGVDELSLEGDTLVCEWTEKNGLRRFTVNPDQVGLSRAPLEALEGGDATDNAAITRRLLEGERGPKRDATILNAAAALVVSGQAPTLREGVALAAGALDSGAAGERLEALVRATAKETA